MANEPILNQRIHHTGDVADTLRLPFAARQKTRQRVQTVRGRSVAIKLPRGTVLRGGDVLRSDDGFTLGIEAAAETVSCVNTTDPQALARAAYHLGNRHVWVQVGSNQLCYLHDHVLDKMLQQLGIPVSVLEAPFEPEAGAYASGHSHHHSHAHGTQLP